MTTIKKTVSWTTSVGKPVEVKIERTKEVCDEVAYADGLNVKTGVKAVDSIHIEMYVDGKFVTRSFYKPSIVTAPKLTKQGVYGKVGDAYVAKELYDLIIAAIAETDAECIDPEFEAVKSAEIAQEAKKEDMGKQFAAKRAEDIENGLCPYCGTYCYGDCGVNKGGRR